jgi:sorting nexin-4
VETFKSVNPRPVRRRYQDFVWLHTTLSLEYPACIVPPLPEKHRLGWLAYKHMISFYLLFFLHNFIHTEYIKGDRFSSEFITRRQLRFVLNMCINY